LFRGFLEISFSSLTTSSFFELIFYNFTLTFGNNFSTSFFFSIPKSSLRQFAAPQATPYIAISSGLNQHLFNNHAPLIIYRDNKLVLTGSLISNINETRVKNKTKINPKKIALSKKTK